MIFLGVLQILLILGHPNLHALVGQLAHLEHGDRVVLQTGRQVTHHQVGSQRRVK